MKEVSTVAPKPGKKISQPKLTVGLDLGDRNSWYCVLEESGQIQREQRVRNLGGDEVICTANEDLRARLQELTGGKGVERAIDCVAGELGAEVARNLAPGGTMLVYGALSSHRQTDPAKFLMPLFAPRLIYSTATVRGWWLPRWVPSQPLDEVRAAKNDLLTMLSKGALTPPTSVLYSLKDFQEAVRLADGE